MDYLTLKGLSIQGSHGYYEEERVRGNRFEVDLVFGLNLAPAGKSDDLEKTVDYQAAETIVRDVIHGESVRLIETLAWRIGKKLFSAFPFVEELEVRVRKMDPPLKTETRHSEASLKWKR